MAATLATQPTRRTQSRHKPAHLRKSWLVVGAVACLVAISYIIFVILNWPFTQQALIDVLQERSVRSVTIDHFYRTYWPPGCVAEGISFLHRKHKNKQPLITIRKLVIKSTYPRLLVQHSLSKVVAVGMHVTVPPEDPQTGKDPIMPLTHTNNPGPSLVIGTVVADGAVLDFVQRDSNKPPFRIVIDRLALAGVGNNRPLSYWATISNSLPPGEIRSDGTFGPWNPDNPATTLVNGSYTYRDANLAKFTALSGTLSASGKFHGILGHINTSGTAEVPNFHLTDTSHTRKLSAGFQAIVDATHGNTTLENVTAHFDQTTVVFDGEVVGLPGQQGKTVSLEMSAANGRIEDLLNLFISAKQPPMTGSVSFRAHVDVPPGSEEFVKRMRLDGDFGVDAGKFTDKDTQSTINRLAGEDRKQEDIETALSDLKGHAVVRNGVAELSNIFFRASDANAWMHGTYGLIEPYPIDLHGSLLTDHPSDATTGFKSFLLKAMSPFLKREGKAKVVPFKITGTYAHTETGLDFGAKK